MKKLYAHESFEVSVDLELVWKSSRGSICLRRRAL
jgi:hypothetical protein